MSPATSLPEGARALSPELVGVALAGGQSRRMGHDKARLRLAGATLAQRCARKLAAVCAEVVLADGGRQSADGWRSIPDGPGRGPLAGVLGAADLYPGHDLLVLACDLPLVPQELLERLAGAGVHGARGESAALVPRWRRGVEPLCARYRPAALEHFARSVGLGRFAVHRQLAELPASYLESEELAGFGDPEQMFLNLNRPQDLERLASVSSPDLR